MKRVRLLATVLALVLAVVPGLVLARAGGGASVGSRGSQTYSRPPSTSTAPGTAAPMQRSVTPQQAPAPGVAPGMAPSFASRSPFMSGLMGGLIGAGIGGLLFGGGMFGGVSGIGGFLGFLVQIFLVVLAVRFVVGLIRRRQPALAGGNPFTAQPPPGSMPMAGGGGVPQPPRVTVAQEDFQEFERLLKAVQAAWSAHDVGSLQMIATPEMVSYFSEQMTDQAGRGVRNAISDVRLEKGDLSEAWTEQGREFATVAMRFSMVDVTQDATGRVVDGSLAERTMVTEVWTFVRPSGGRWLVSAIQQTS